LTPEQKLQKAKIGMLQVHPFYATLGYKLAFEPTTRPDIPYFATDGKSLFYNPACDIFTEDTVECIVDPWGQVARVSSVDALKGCLSHEYLHGALSHCTRRGSREPLRWNRACDYLANSIVLDSGLPLPKGALVNKAYSTLTAEKVYELLGSDGSGKQPQPQPGQGGQPGSGKPQPGSGQPQPGQPGQQPSAPDPSDFGKVLDSPSKDPLERQAEERDWRVSVQQALNAAKIAGKVPAGLQRLAESLREPKVDWKVVLRRFVADTVVSDYSLRKPDRHYIPFDLFVPGPVKDGCGALAAFIDLSGSISPKTVTDFQSEVNAIHDECKPEKLYVAGFDTVVHGAEFGPDEEIDWKQVLVGGGGTSFRPIFDWISEHASDIKCAVILTDLYGDTVDKAKIPDYPVLWISTTPNKQGQFGETVEY